MKKTRLLAKIVSLAMAVQCISTTSLVAFADEDVNITADETVSASDIDDEYISYFNAVISVTVQGTGENLDGVDVKFVEYSEDTSLNSDAEIVAVLDSWNTSDSNPHTIENIGFTEGHFYCAEIEQFPDGYSVGGSSYISTGYHGSGILSGTMPYEITPENKPPFAKLDFPVEGVWTSTFSVRDIVSTELLGGLDVELVSMDSDYNVQEVLAEWTTSEDEVYSVELPYYFDNDHTTSYYGVKIKNLPEGYVYHNTDSQEAPHNGYSVFSYSALDLLIEMREPEIYSKGMHTYNVYLREENAVVEATTYPHTTTTTTAVVSDDDTTTATTAAPEDDTTTTVSEDDTTTTTAVSDDDTTTTTTVSDDDTMTTTTVSDDDTTTTTTVSDDDTTTTTTVSDDDTMTTTSVSEDDTTTTTAVSDDDTVTTTTTVSEDLPQAGMPFAKIIEGMSLMLVIGGTMLVVKSKRNED